MEPMAYYWQEIPLKVVTGSILQANYYLELMKRDKEGRPKSDPNYDPRTLYVPAEFRKSQTPALRQWWDLKVDHFDVIFFFKVGKFYELYYNDTIIGH